MYTNVPMIEGPLPSSFIVGEQPTITKTAHYLTALGLQVSPTDTEPKNTQNGSLDSASLSD